MLPRRLSNFKAIYTCQHKILRGLTVSRCLMNTTLLQGPVRPQAIGSWLIVNQTLRNKLWWNSNQNAKHKFQQNEIQSVVCEMAAILSRPRCDNPGVWPESGLTCVQDRTQTTVLWAIIPLNGNYLPSGTWHCGTMVRKNGLLKSIHGNTLIDKTMPS